MADREKLIELIEKARKAMNKEEFSCALARNSFIAEYLITNGKRKTLITQFCERCNEEMSESPCEPSDCFARDVIMAIPAEEVETVKHGRWLPQIIAGEKTWHCSECETLGSPVWKRCPVCEAKMDLEADHAKE